jgi:hypothetical protein
MIFLLIDSLIIRAIHSLVAGQLRPVRSRTDLRVMRIGLEPAQGLQRDHKFPEYTNDGRSP